MINHDPEKYYKYKWNGIFGVSYIYFLWKPIGVEIHLKPHSTWQAIATYIRMYIVSIHCYQFHLYISGTLTNLLRIVIRHDADVTCIGFCWYSCGVWCDVMCRWHRHVAEIVSFDENPNVDIISQNPYKHKYLCAGWLMELSYKGSASG